MTTRAEQGRSRESHVKIDRAEVAQRAYELWGAAGGPLGRDLEFWLQAEAELLSAECRRFSKLDGAEPRHDRKNAQGHTQANHKLGAHNQ